MLITKRFLKIFFLFGFVIQTTAQVSNDYSLFAPANRLRFGNYLYSQKDYLRAIDEYNAFLSYKSDDTLKFKIAFAFSEMGKSQAAFNSLNELFNSSKLANYSSIYYAREKLINNELNYFNNPDKIIPQLLIKNKFVYRKNFQMMKNFALLLSNDAQIKFPEFILPFSDNVKAEAEIFYNRWEDPNYKSETAAGILSAIIPGSGKIYSNKIGDGVTAFVVTGLLTFLAVDNFNSGHKLRAWIFTGFASAFYAGNIYGSVIAAQQYNFGIRINFLKEIKLFFNKFNYFAPLPDFLKN